MAKKKFFHAEQDLPTTTYDVEYVLYKYMIVHYSFLLVPIGESNVQFCCRYLADLMDNPVLIRNVALAGHLHTGKVTVLCFQNIFSLKCFKLKMFFFVI